MTARDVLEAHAATPLHRLAATGAYEYVLTKAADAVVAFQTRTGMALALGGPVGPAPTHASAAADFADEAKRRRLQPAFVAVNESAARELSAAGYHLYCIGEEARLELVSFTLRGNARKSLRQSAAHARRAGLTVAVWAPPHPPARSAELARVSAAWLSARRLPERWFGTGRYCPRALEAGRVAVALDARGRVAAFCSLVEGYCDQETGLDFMRLHPNAPAGTMDLLLSGLAVRLRDQGKAVLNLGLAPLSVAPGGPTGDPAAWVLRAVRRGLLAQRRWYNFHGLHAYKRKFRPRWSRQYLAVRHRRHLPRALLALLEIRPRPTS